MASPMRDTFRIHALHFGSGEKAAAIVGAMRGDEVQQLYIVSQVARRLDELEAAGLLVPGKRITVIPSANPFSMNIEKRFWALDNTDINRMFPGYDLGETTQRIAAQLFKQLEGYTYGLQLASFYMPGEFIPHVRLVDTGYQDLEAAALLGLPYTLLRTPRPYDTTLLNYNWQLWGTKAMSLYAGQCGVVADAVCEQMVQAILDFLSRAGLLRCKPAKEAEPQSQVIGESQLVTIKAPVAGIYVRHATAPESVEKGQLLAQILDPLRGTPLAEIKAPARARIFFAHAKALALQHTPLFKLLPLE